MRDIAVLGAEILLPDALSHPLPFLQHLPRSLRPLERSGGRCQNALLVLPMLVRVHAQAQRLVPRAPDISRRGQRHAPQQSAVQVGVAIAVLSLQV